jgi:hypothetical protein
MSKIAYPIAYLRREDFIKNIMSTFIKNRRKVDAVFGQTQVLNILDYKYEDQNPDISFDNLSKGIKVGGFTD